MAQKFKKGQLIRIRDLDELPVGTMDMPRSQQGLALAGRTGKILDIGGNYVVLDVELNTELGPQGVHFYEIESYTNPDVHKRFKVTLMDGKQYFIECTDDAMKELAEFIGDDHLEMIHQIKKEK